MTSPSPLPPVRCARRHRASIAAGYDDVQSGRTTYRLRLSHLRWCVVAWSRGVLLPWVLKERSAPRRIWWRSGIIGCSAADARRRRVGGRSREGVRQTRGVASSPLGGGWRCDDVVGLVCCGGGVGFRSASRRVISIAVPSSTVRGRKGGGRPPPPLPACSMRIWFAFRCCCRGGSFLVAATTRRRRKHDTEAGIRQAGGLGACRRVFIHRHHQQYHRGPYHRRVHGHHRRHRRRHPPTSVVVVVGGKESRSDAQRRDWREGFLLPGRRRHGSPPLVAQRREPLAPVLCRGGETQTQQQQHLSCECCLPPLLPRFPLQVWMYLV